jgi:hypothetical protein
VLLLSGLALAGVEFHTERRLAIHAEAERALEATYEQLRAGVLPLVAGELAVPFAAEAGRLHLEVEPAATPALYEIRVIATYRANGVDFHRELEALLWRP